MKTDKGIESEVWLPAQQGEQDRLLGPGKGSQRSDGAGLKVSFSPGGQASGVRGEGRFGILDGWGWRSGQKPRGEMGVRGVRDKEQ